MVRQIELVVLMWLSKRDVALQVKKDLYKLFGLITFINLWLGLVLFTPQFSWAGTALGDLAASMQPKTWAELVTNGLTFSLIDDCNGHNILQYSDDALWDPNTKRFLYLGTGHLCPGKFIAYSDATNSWSLVQGLSGSIGIHSYDHNAINPANGTVYNRPSGYGYREVRKYTGSWSNIPNLPESSVEVAGALEYFPEMGGLIYVNGGTKSVSFYNLSTNQWTVLASGLSFAGYHNFAAYSPVHKVMIFGGGNDSSNVYRLTAAGNITKMGNAPINLGIWHHSVVTVDPIGGDFLFLGSDQSFRYYNPMTDTWTTLTGAVPIWNLSSACDGKKIGCIVATPVSTYGVIMFLIWNEGEPKIFLYKHTGGSPLPPDTQAPTTPTNLSATAVSSSQINLSWTASTDNVGVAGYRIYRGGTQIATSTSTSYQNAGLSPSTTYSYTVAAYDASGNVSSQSSSASTTTQSSPPPGSDLVAAYSFNEGSGPTAADYSGNNHSAALINGPTWTAGKFGNALSFDGSNDYLSVANPSTLSLGNQFTLEAWVKRTTLSQGTQRHLLTKCATSWTTGCKEWYFGRSDEYRYGTAGYGDIQASALTDTASWHHIAIAQDQTTRRLYLDGSLVSAANVGPEVDGTSHIIDIGRHAPSSEYYAGLIDELRIYSRALTQYEIQTDMNTPIGGTPPPPDTQAPTTPTNLSATAVSSSQINLSWTASTDNVGVAGYRIYRGGTQIATSTSTSYQNTGLSPSTTYSYTVTAYDASGNVSAQSSPVNATTQAMDSTNPSTPTGLTATSVSSSQINLSWTASTDNMGVTGYSIYRSGTQIATSTSTSFQNTGLSPSTTYSYTVAAYDAAGNVSGQSTSASATTAASSPPSSGTSLYNFNTGGPLTCTGVAPNITCTDTSKWLGWSYYSGVSGFRQDSDTNYTLQNKTGSGYEGVQGYLEIDNTKGAIQTAGSLKLTVTGCYNSGGVCPTECGGAIDIKALAQNYPSRICTGTNYALPYVDLTFPGGKHHPEFVNADRITMYVYAPTYWHYRTSYGGPADDNFHIGTYVCKQSDDPCIDRSGCSPWSWGEPCNGDNGHFYHFYTIAPFGGGGWTKLYLDQNPQYHRYGPNPPYNPTVSMNTGDFTAFGENYIPSLTRMYFDGKAEGDFSTTGSYNVWIDEIKAESKGTEVNQNETTITSVAIGYQKDGNGYWDISFSTELESFGTYQIKYSTTEFTNINYATNGSYITPLSSIVTSPSGQGMIGKWRNEQTTYNRYATQFSLPAQYQVAGTTVYFAIKDVSSSGSHGCSENGNNPDSRTSTNSNIYSVSYTVSSATGEDSKKPSPPSSLQVQ